ncbi:regulatory protein RecX [Marinobacter orientalis]|uniref:Regulatory protein RecX n=1 Tax=Marinobacter orientalis TaxID=1928859 RepID=A0A7Y0RC95_9GAMM|nr:regulatory protein RecX [Marinobacter orientalis]NMT63573.1 regulatory protein RecX [Marinobacter orientalis]TGX48628.1 regulatory protein RecX [Marinobacter orientalis]
MGKASNPDDQDYRARSAALRLLARREHSRLELSLKLMQRKFESAVIDRILDDYESEGWLSDERFADIYARQRIDLGYGPLRILAELQQRGVHAAPGCMREMTDADWIERATLLREKRFGLCDISEDWDEKARQARFLARRGFASDQVESALERRL